MELPCRTIKIDRYYRSFEWTLSMTNTTTSTARDHSDSCETVRPLVWPTLCTMHGANRRGRQAR